MRFWMILVFLTVSCGTASPPAPTLANSTPAPREEALPATMTLSLVGTNDLHGHVERLPAFAGYLRNLRAARERDHGRVILLDGGDMFQGTLESNMNEGAAIVDAYNALRYDAVAVGNHEFDFGPAGERATPRDESDNARGALFSRMGEARYPFLSANIVDERTGAIPNTPNFHPTTMIEAGTMRIGVIGLSTESTPHTTISANFRGLAMRPLVATVLREAAALRAAGATIVLITAHAGTSCHVFTDPSDSSSCETDEEIVELANALPEGSIQGIVAGHTHAGVAHFIHGVPIIESYSTGTSFGRIDFTVNRASGRVEHAHVFAPERICGGERAPACETASYEGAPIVRDEALAALLAPRIEAARSVRNESLHAQLGGIFRRSHDEESPLGNLLADWMLAAQSGDIAIVNGGGIRADLPAGELNYGALYETFPFDNRFAVVELSGAQLRNVLLANVMSSGGILSIGGVTVRAECRAGEARVEIIRTNGRPVRDSDRIRLITSDFLATGGDRALAGVANADNTRVIEEGANIRDGIAAYLRAHPASYAPDDARIYSADHRRWTFAGERPFRCSTR